ncbi:hypothetical protein DL98DRAFT_107405 [Cadophora sp. DSE1049]|nr:hypothetical protein DL98DRAFT_107405 [Cadophora sp. DSE1049]
MKDTSQLPEPNNTTLLQADPNDEVIDLSDVDSTTSPSVTSSIRSYQYENGRCYHALREGEYLLPNNERRAGSPGSTPPHIPTYTR